MKKPKTSVLTRKTKRLILRPLQLRDDRAWAAAYSTMRPPQNEWDETNWEPKFLTIQEHRKNLKHQRDLLDQDKSYILGIFHKGDGALIGYVSLMDISRGVFQNAYIGYRIFNPYWGHGYAKEAVAEMLKLGFKDLYLHRIEAGIQPKNKASISVAKAVGMRREGLSKKRLFYHGKWIDLVIYAATCEDMKIKHRFAKASSR